MSNYRGDRRYDDDYRFPFEDERRPAPSRRTGNVTRRRYEDEPPYETPPRRRTREPQRRRRPGCLTAPLRLLLRIVAVLLVAALLLGVLLVNLPVTAFRTGTDMDVAADSALPASPCNVLILGVDSLQDGYQRSDTMMIASISSGTLKLTSLERDVLVDIPDHGTQKLNAAYTFGGPELAVRCVNRLYGMNITRYLVIDFTALVRMVDAIGGIEVSITEDEMRHINKNVLMSRSIFEPLGYRATELKQYGERVHLDGLQALGYSRIRKLDSDLKRMQRQRIVITAMLRRLRAVGWMVWKDASFLSAAVDGIRTNIGLPELISLGEKVLLAEEYHELRLPVDGSYTDNGSSFTVTDRKANLDKLHIFLYGRPYS